MAGLNETPRGNRIHIAFFGLRNAGKSTLVNAFTGQNLAIVSDVPGTTTDPVSKAMEILPLGPCLVTDTAGLDDEGELGRQRVEKTLKVLETTDIAVWVDGRAGCPQPAATGNKREDVVDRLRRAGDCAPYRLVVDACAAHKVTLLEYHRGESVEELKRKIAAVKLEDQTPGLLDGLVAAGDRVVCVVPIDESAPRGRLILPQQQVIRECLDRHVICTVCQPEELTDCLIAGLTDLKGRLLVVTDSQAFGAVNEIVQRLRCEAVQSPNLRLTSFSILFARQKGDLDEYVKGLAAIKTLKDGDTVLVAEGCTHHRQCNDIGSVKIPKALKKLSGKDLKFAFSSGSGFLDSCASLTSGRETASTLAGEINQSNNRTIEQFSLIVHCGGCMQTRREMLRRIALAREAGIPIVNYGILLAAANGIDVGKVIG